MRISIVNPIDFLSLPWTERFLGIQTPGAFQQTLASQDFVQAGDASCEVVGDVEESCVAISDLGAFLDEAFRNAFVIASVGLTLLQ